MYLNIFALIYLNNIFIYSSENSTCENFKLLKKHVNQIKMILKKLIFYKLYYKLNTCKFHMNNVNFLNFKIFFQNIDIQKKRVLIIQN